MDSPRKRKVKRKVKRNVSRKRQTSKKDSQNRYRFITRPRSNPIELENRRVSPAFKSAMKTIPQGCRLDPVPWWDDEIDDTIILRAQLRKITDDRNADPATLELRALNYKTQAEATRELIREPNAQHLGRNSPPTTSNTRQIHAGRQV